MSNDPSWSAVEAYLVDNLLSDDYPAAKIYQANKAADLPPIDVAPTEGKMLQLMVRMAAAKHVLEIGTLGGFSAICMARGLPDGGHLTTIELSERHAAVALQNIREAGVADKVTVKVGAGLDVLPTLDPNKKFDFVFIDADKANVPNYYEWALKLTHPGSIVVVDNVVRGGAVVNSETQDENINGVRRLIESLKSDPRVSTTALQTVGTKGYDGFLVAYVL